MLEDILDVHLGHLLNKFTVLGDARVQKLFNFSPVESHCLAITTQLSLLFGRGKVSSEHAESIGRGHATFHHGIDFHQFRVIVVDSFLYGRANVLPLVLRLLSLGLERRRPSSVRVACGSLNGDRGQFLT